MNIRILLVLSLFVANSSHSQSCDASMGLTDSTGVNGLIDVAVKDRLESQVTEEKPQAPNAKSTREPTSSGSLSTSLIVFKFLNSFRQLWAHL